MDIDHGYRDVEIERVRARIASIACRLSESDVGVEQPRSSTVPELADTRLILVADSPIDHAWKVYGNCAGDGRQASAVAPP